MNTPAATVDGYIATFPDTTQVVLRTIRSAVSDVVPGMEESISYGLPTLKLNGKPVIYYGAFAHHIGFYATPDGHAEFEPELSKYKRGKGSVQFPLDQPMPLDLMKRITQYRAATIIEGV